MKQKQEKSLVHTVIRPILRRSVPDIAGFLLDCSVWHHLILANSGSVWTAEVNSKREQENKKKEHHVFYFMDYIWLDACFFIARRCIWFCWHRNLCVLYIMLFCSIGICGIYNRIFTIFGIDYRVFNYIVYSICAYKANVKFNDTIILLSY